MTETPEMPLYMRRDGFGPVEELARARDTEGVVELAMPWGVSAYLVSRYEDVRRVFADAATFSSSPPRRASGSGDKPVPRRDGMLIMYDPPEHTRLRKMLSPEFTVRRMRRIEPRVTEIVAAALDDTERAGRPADLVSLFALPVPSLVISELLGVPYADRAGFQERSRRMLDLSLPGHERMEAGRASREYMTDLVARARAEPGDDMLGMLVREHSGDLSTEELIGVADLLLLAGHETTSNMLGLGTLALLRNPEQLALLRDDPSRMEAAIEELLRWLSIVHTLPPRITTAPVEIAGHAIPAGALIIPSIPAANRDGSFIEDPDTLDVTRGAPGHLAFGHGVHHCLGAPLARMEMRLAFPALLRRFPGLALADPGQEADFKVSSIVFGLKSLQVTW
jgi:cytochrome P450